MSHFHASAMVRAVPCRTDVATVGNDARGWYLKLDESANVVEFAVLSFAFSCDTQLEGGRLVMRPRFSSNPAPTPAQVAAALEVGFADLPLAREFIAGRAPQ